jgi:peptide/nickel transport system substrate-binding protein
MIRVRPSTDSRVILALAAWLLSAGVENSWATFAENGRSGGRLVIAQRAEPKTLNPVIASDIASREVITRTTADLMRIDRITQRIEPALARSCDISNGGRRYVLRLRRGLRFSDGHPFDADDVVFTFQVFLDEKLHSPQRELLIVGGKPITVRKLDQYTVVFEMAAPYAPAQRLFDGFPILPRHLLEKAWTEGRLAQSWGLGTPPSQIAGMGPFRLKEYVPGQRIVLERNPYYWNVDGDGKPLPYLDSLVFVFVPNEDGQALRFQAGETDVISRIGARNFAVLEREQKARGYTMRDLGPGLEYNFIFFNMNDLGGKLPQVAARQVSFREQRFRQAVSSAIDREAIVRLVYQGRAYPLFGHVAPGNHWWLDANLPRPPRSLERARGLLREAGFTWNRDGALLDPAHRNVEFSIVAPSSSPERVQIATIVQDDLRQLGMNVRVVPLEFRAMLDRLFNSRDYDAAVLGLGGGDADPTAEMNVWLSSGGTHIWNLGQSRPATPWEAEIDDLMRRQLTATRYNTRKKLYDRVQEIVAERLPIICIASPHVLVGAKNGLGNFRPAVLDHHTLWNVEEIYWRTPAAHR